MKEDSTDKKPPTWRAPTRRRFVQMIAAAAAALAVRDREHKPPPIWIGHY